MIKPHKIKTKERCKKLHRQQNNSIVSEKGCRRQIGYKKPEVFITPPRTKK